MIIAWTPERDAWLDEDGYWHAIQKPIYSKPNPSHDDTKKESPKKED